jgi:hypothetical protein
VEYDTVEYLFCLTTSSQIYISPLSLPGDQTSKDGKSDNDKVCGCKDVRRWRTRERALDGGQCRDDRTKHEQQQRKGDIIEMVSEEKERESGIWYNSMGAREMTGRVGTTIRRILECMN